MMAYVELSEALHEMADQLESFGQRQVQIGGFTAGRTVANEGPVEAASPGRFHRLCSLWHFHQPLG